MPAPLVRVHDLRKAFTVRRPVAEVVRRPFDRRHVAALRGVSLEVAAGEFYGLLGPNGAGKTTLFKTLATLVLPDSGSVTIAGHDALADPAAVRRVLTPVLADERSLNWRLTALENLLLFAALYRLPSPERRPAATRLLEVVGLAAAADRMVGTYSSGMKQRLLIARALLSRPAVLLLDEPTRSLDPVSARDFRAFLREEIAGRQGCTVLLATHDADEALDLCDRLGVLHHGRMVAEGTARQLAARAGHRRWRLLVPAPDIDRALGQLPEGFARADGASAEGWVPLEGDVDGGPVAAAALLASLVTARVPVSEFGPVPLRLADLIERLADREAAA